jgi:thiol-disulfide isomerase/thioredoxin
MKRFFCFLSLLCLFFGAGAQENMDTKSGANNIGPLQIGDRVPPVVLSGLINGAGLTVKDLSAFKGKLLVLDFWATWCSPCVAMMPKMDSLQQAYQGKVQFLPVAYQNKTTVETFLNKLEKQKGRKERLPVLTGDTLLGKLFPHSVLPHLVWIGGDGTVKAITDQDALNSTVIERLLAGKDPGVRMKKDEVMTYDKSSRLFSINDGSEPGVSFAVSGYKEGVGRGFYNDTMIPGNGTDRRMTARNNTLPELYRLAYSKQKKETVLELADTAMLSAEKLHGDSFLDWLKQGHAFCMELVLPDSARANANTILRKRLDGYFSAYSARLEKRHLKCLALVRTSTTDKLKSSGGKPAVVQDAFGAKFENCYLRVFLSRMQLPLQFNPFPLVDETGYTGKADIELSGDLSNLAELNSELAKYDLRFEEKPADLEMLVIRDAAKAKP